MKKIILFKGGIETQGYFSEQLEKAFLKMGHEVFMYDFEKERQHCFKMLRFIEKGNTVMITFNFHGISEDTCFQDENHQYVWEAFDIPCYNIVVDHPFYYHGFLNQVPPNYYHISIDKNHVKYMRRFFPHIQSEYFLPLAGTPVEWTEDFIPMKNRSEEICFTGNYSPPATFDKYIDRHGKEYGDFYRGIIEELLNHPERLLEDVAEKHIRREIPEVTEEEIKQTIPNMIFIDLYIRNYMRGRIIAGLAEAGMKVHVYGGGWEELECRQKKNIILGGSIDSHTCLRKIADSKISVNVMPWFKDGAHDRIFNTMLNRAVCLTDSSTYLENILRDKDNCLIYQLNDMEEMLGKVTQLLEQPDELEYIARNGYAFARKYHTWENRAVILEQWIENM